MIGKILAEHYKIIYLLGSGSFAKVYLAQDKHDVNDPWRVIKKLDPLLNPLINNMTLEESKRRFEIEAEMLKFLGEHNKIPKLFDYFEEEKSFYLVEEFIDGHELEEQLNYNRFDNKQLYIFLRKILEILIFIERNNVIHRDIKPTNIISRTVDRELVLIDFGAVKQIIDPEGQKRQKTTLAIGTNPYMPAEQANGSPKPCSDIHALGVIGIQACIGYPPEEKDEDDEFVWRSEANIFPPLGDILDKMTRYYFKHRYQSASEVIHDLEKISLEINLLNDEVNYHKPNPAKTWYDRENTLKNIKHHEEAIILYNKAIETKPRYYKAWFNKGIALSYLKLYIEAIESYKKAINLKPKSSEAWFHKGIAFYQISSYENALISFEKALQFKPFYPKTYFF